MVYQRRLAGLIDRCRDDVQLRCGDDSVNVA